VEDVSLERFAHGHSVRIRSDLRRFDPGAVVERARSRLGERSYRILTNNCEHFCTWALRDENRSLQVDRVRAAPRVLCQAVRTYYQRIIGHQRRIGDALRFWRERHALRVGWSSSEIA
jgi:hypothetical protein